MIELWNRDLTFIFIYSTRPFWERSCISGLFRSFINCLIRMKKVLKKLEINTDKFNPYSFINAIGKAKNELIGADQFLDSISGFYEEMAAKAYAAYQKELKVNAIKSNGFSSDIEKII